MAERRAVPSRGFSRALLRWYDESRRDLPWRRAPSPYRTLVSELMLQQTVVATVIPYFHRFVERFPTMAALAAASEDDVLALWSGLGYYSRARNLHRTARMVMTQHNGELPADEASLRALPGVGAYTAAAVAAIAFGQRTFALDGNAARVVARLFAISEPIDRPAVRVRLRAFGDTLVPKDRPGDFAQAVMELGARVCVGKARCEVCPVAAHCLALLEDRVSSLPVRLARRPKKKVAVACVVVERRGRVLLVRRLEGTLLGGTWVLPLSEVAEADEDRQAARQTLQAFGMRSTGRVSCLGFVRHVFTHRDLVARVLRVTGGREKSPANSNTSQWVDLRKLEGLALSSFTRKTLALVS